MFLSYYVDLFGFVLLFEMSGLAYDMLIPITGAYGEKWQKERKKKKDREKNREKKSVNLGVIKEKEEKEQIG